MTRESEKKLVERISFLASQKIDTKQDEWGIGWDAGYRQACLQILEMITKCK